MSVFKNNTFLLFTFFVIIENVLDLIRCVISLVNAEVPVGIFIFLNVVYYSVEILIGLAFYIYCCAIVNYFKRDLSVHNIVSNAWIMLPFVLGVIYIIVTSFFNNSFFSVFYLLPEALLIKNGTFGYVFICLIALFYAFHGAVLILKNSKELEKHDFFHILKPISLMIVSVIAQQLYPYARFISFALAMGTLDLSLYIQRPQDIYDTKKGVFNLNGFQMMLNHLLNIRKNFHVYAIAMDDCAFYSNALGKKERANLDACIISSLKTSFHKSTSVYKLNDFGNYALIIKKSKHNPVDQVLKKITNQIELHWGFSSMDLDLSFRVCVIESFIDVSSYSEISDIIDYFVSLKKFKGKVVKANSMDLSKLHSYSYLERAIDQGLKNNRFEVYYQPIYNVQEQALTGAEALIRLRDENGNFVSPEDFIPVAEQNGTIFDIGKFVFKSVCQTLSEINLDEYKLKKVDINLSVIQCIQEDMAKQLIAIRNQYHIPANLINIEITETASTNTPDVLLKNMVELEVDGIELSLDDYGSGNSNISYILTLPFKIIKIDKGIVWKAFEDPKANIVLKSTIDMVKELGISVLAEGVETEVQAEKLMKLGCSYLQGYYYSRPVPVAKFLEIIKN